VRAERGERIDIAKARKMAQALGVEYAQLLHGDAGSKASPAA
jgi:hypothetical protein